MFSGSREQQRNEIMRRVNKLRAAAAQYPHLRDVLTAFDGKVLNVRLENALTDGGNRYFVKLRRNEHYGDYLDISFHQDGDGNYTDDCYLVSLNLDKKWDGKRIPSDVILENARERREDFLREAAALEAATPELADEIENKIKALRSAFDALVEGIPRAARSVYGLEYHISRW